MWLRLDDNSGFCEIDSVFFARFKPFIACRGPRPVEFTHTMKKTSCSLDHYSTNFNAENAEADAEIPEKTLSNVLTAAESLMRNLGLTNIAHRQKPAVRWKITCWRTKLLS
jgi:hypothetical protein